MQSKTKKVAHLVNERKAVGVVSLDFSKAIDTIFHSILWKNQLFMTWTCALLTV